MKACTRCGTEKPASEFYARRSKRDGLHSWCKGCCRQDTRDFQNKPGWREHKAEYDRNRVAALKPRLSAQGRARYLANRDARLQAAREWAAQNPDARRIISMNYKAKRRAQEESGMSSADLKAWKDSQVKVCFWCDADCASDHHVDHMEPLSRGGLHEAANLVISCPTCNLRKQAMPPELWLERVLAA